MEIDETRIDEAVLALLHLTLDDAGRAWKAIDFEVMNRLHAKGLIADPVNKNKSVLLTEKGLAESKRLFESLFAKNPDKGAPSRRATRPPAAPSDTCASAIPATNSVTYGWLASFWSWRMVSSAARRAHKRTGTRCPRSGS
jgi:Domain of unknown function (DUF6429)